MFLAVILGYAVAAVFVFCGVAQAIFYFQGVDQAMGAQGFVGGLALALWPLAVGVALHVLVQIAIMIERQCIMQEHPAEPLPDAPAPRAKKPAAPPRPAPPDPLPAGSYFHAAPAPVAPPARESVPAAAAPRPYAEAGDAGAKGGMPPKDGADNAAGGGAEAEPAAKKQEDLSFFRIG